MPCRDDRDSCSVVYRTPETVEKKLKAQEEKLDLYARLLCYSCTKIEQLWLEIYDELPWNELKSDPKTEEHGDAAAELHKWWVEHQEFDRKERKKKEELERKERKKKADAESALKKLNALTESERAALVSLGLLKK